MSAAYTDADVQAAKRPILDNFHPPSDRIRSWHIRPDEMARAVLDAVAPAIAASALDDLIDRLERAESALGEREGMAVTLHGTVRLRAKAEGVRLARSYAEEHLRELRT